MPPRQISVPIRGRWFPGSSLRYLYADLPLFVRTSGGPFVAVEFRVDTGAHMTEVSEDWAKMKSIPVVGSPLAWTITTGSGTAVFTGILGSIRVRPPRWTGVEFDWPCFFRRNRPVNLPVQLGMAGVISDVRLLVEGTPSPNAPYGVLRVEEL